MDRTRRMRQLCTNGNLQRLKNFLESMTEEEARNLLLTKSFTYFEGGRTVVHEATEAGLPEHIRYLVTNWDIDVNSKTTNMGYTALHYASSHGHVNCVKVLLEVGADMTITDNWSKTAKQTAELSGRKRIVKILTSAEVIKEVENNGNNLMKLIGKLTRNDLEDGCLERALLIAIKNGSHTNVGKLIVKGATNLEEGLKMSIELMQHNVIAMILLLQIAQNGDKDLLFNIFDEQSAKPLLPCICEADSKQIREFVMTKKVSTVFAIELARQRHNGEIREELMLKTDIYEDKGAVHWHALHLISLEKSWFSRIQWVRELRLARNRLTEIPEEIEPYFRQITKLDLRFNDLVYVPKFLLLLPNLTHLNLASNKLTEFPHEWSPTLTVLDIADNQLSTLPDTLVAPSITKLFIDRNRLRAVPLSVCSLTTLQHLDISGNKEIETLPTEMGLLTNLDKLGIKGLPKLCDPPREMLLNSKHCIQYLKCMHLSSRRLYMMKLMIVGDWGVGKTKLASRLECVDPYAHVCGNQDVTEWIYSTGFNKRKYRFGIWEISGLNEYVNTHQLFLKPVERTMYLLLWNVKHGENGVAELKPWLDNISLRAPQSCVLIVGTHLDEVAGDQRPAYVDDLMKKVKELADKYPTLNIADIVTVGLEKPLENIGPLRESIYNNASLQKRNQAEVMGQKIPAVYYQLIWTIQRAREDCHCRGLGDHVLNTQQFKSLVHELNLTGLHSDEEIETAVSFLNSLGTIYHCSGTAARDKYPGLDEVYFINPYWLSSSINKMISSDHNQWVRDGVMHCKDIPKLFDNDELFPWWHFDQFISLLNHLYIALPLDSQQLLVPSLLPSDCPPDTDMPAKLELYYSNRITFPSAYPLGMWGRLVAIVLRAIPDICTLQEEEDATTDSSTTVGANTLPIEPESSSSQPPSTDMVTECFPKPLELPRIQKSFTNFTTTNADHDDTQQQQHQPGLVYWANGVVFKSSTVFFSVTSVDHKYLTKITDQRQIVIKSNPTPKGVKVLKLLTKLVSALVNHEYSGYSDYVRRYERSSEPPMKHTIHIVCNECLKSGNPTTDNDVTYSVSTLKTTTATCRRGHEMSIADFIPPNDKEK